MNHTNLLSKKIIIIDSDSRPLIERARHFLAQKFFVLSDSHSEALIRKAEKHRIALDIFARLIGGKNFTRDLKKESNLFPNTDKVDFLTTIWNEKNNLINELLHSKSSSEERFNMLVERSCVWTGLARTSYFQLLREEKGNKTIFYVSFKFSAVNPHHYPTEKNERSVKEAKKLGLDKKKILVIKTEDVPKLFNDLDFQNDYLKNSGLVIKSLFSGKGYLINNRKGLPANCPYDIFDMFLLAITGRNIEYTMGEPVTDCDGRRHGIELGVSFERDKPINLCIKNILKAHSKLLSYFPAGSEKSRPPQEIDIVEAYAQIFYRIAQKQGVVNEQAEKDLINITGNAIKKRDVENPGHSERVSIFAKLIADQMDLSAKEKTTLFIGCVIHDIGKITTPDNVLNKKGSLTLEEYKIIQQHTQKGYDIVNENISEAFKLCAKAPLYHHENYAWSKYFNLKLKNEWQESGVRMNLLLSIIACADRFDTILSNRPYKEGKSLDYAIEEIFTGTFTEFHPKVTHAFLPAILNEIKNNKNNIQYFIADRKKLLQAVPWYIEIINSILENNKILKIFDTYAKQTINDDALKIKAINIGKNCFRELISHEAEALLKLPIDNNSTWELNKILNSWYKNVLKINLKVPIKK